VTAVLESSARPGGCICGAVRYELTADPVTLYACHCTDCQRATGTSFALSMIVTHEAVALVRGEPELHECRLDDGRHLVASARGSHLDAQRSVLVPVARRRASLRGAAG
jgi:hypothetical protein